MDEDHLNIKIVAVSFRPLICCIQINETVCVHELMNIFKMHLKRCQRLKKWFQGLRSGMLF